MHPEYLLISVLLSLLSVSMACPGGVLSYLPGLLSLCSLAGAGLFLTCAYIPGKEKRRALFLHLLLLSSCVLISSLLCVSVNRSMDADFSLPKDYVRAIEGRVVYDSSFTENGNHLMKISLDSCTLISGESGTASGVIAAVGKETAILSAGLRVRLEGSFAGDIFVYDSIQVLGRSVLNDIRERVISKLEYRLLGVGSDEPVLLSIRLLLGRADSGKSSIQEKAVLCGCSHVLALSGMHLGIIASIGSMLFRRRKNLASVVSAVLVAAFVFAAGPRASLVRAALFFLLSRVLPEKRICMVFVLQCLLFPASMVETGCCYGYLAVFAITALSPYTGGVLYQYLGKLSRLVSASLSVLVFSVPLQIVINSFWCPAAIIASPAAGLLAAVSMVLGMLQLVFGPVALLMWANRTVYAAMDGLFDLMLRLPHAGWGGYGVMIGILTALFVLNLIAIKRRRKT